MKIIGLHVTDNNTLTVTLDTKLPEVVSEDLYLYIDALNNYKNRNSGNPEDHSMAILIMNTEGDVVEISENRQFITLDSTSPFASAFTVTIYEALAFYYDAEELYYKQIDLLCNHCSTCLDDQQKDRIMLFMLKYNLFQYALEHDILDDIVQYYQDLARMLNINISNSIFNDGHFDCNKCCKGSKSTIRTSCCNCKNGVCSLC